MTSENFNNLVAEIRAASMDTLTAKNAKYATDGDRLHNFVAGGDVMGGTAAQACWGYLTKHLVALRDKVERNDFSDRDDLKEKCQDAINYIAFLWCIGNETHAVERKERTEDEGLGLSEEERAKYSLNPCVTYRDMAKKLKPEWVGCYPGGVNNCPGDLLDGAPGGSLGACPGIGCTHCWDQPYKGERAHDNSSGT